MTLTFAATLDRQTVLDAADLVVELVQRREVAEAWARGSACDGMTVGGLARHLAGQPINVVALVPAEAPQGASAEPIALLQHYARAPWVREDLDGDTNRSIRDTADQQAADGPAAAMQALVAAQAALPDVLEHAGTTTYIPWQGWSLATDDFLVTRLMEMVVHADDLAASVDVRTPEFPPDVLDPVFRLLTALAVRRHGQVALVRTLTRPQRAPATVSAF